MVQYKVHQFVKASLKYSQQEGVSLPFEMKRISWCYCLGLLDKKKKSYVLVFTWIKG